MSGFYFYLFFNLKVQFQYYYLVRILRPNKRGSKSTTCQKKKKKYLETLLHFQGEKPSIASVVGSMNPTVLTLYECEIRAQNSGQNEDIIQDMKDITKKLLVKFYQANGYKPERIVMFR